jgi:L-alanine-DL-glutamate epimerase-like enolase superfamily enzyme
VSVEPFSFPLRAPLSTADGDIGRREGFLIRADGGLGEATPLPGWTEPIDACRAALEGGTPGPGTPAARHGLALARADGAARGAGVPLAAELGGIERRRVPVNATIGDGAPEETAAAAADALEAGFDCLKVKVGARPLDADCERLRALRVRAPDAELRLDANAAYTPGEARDALDAFAAFDPSYVEQPVPPGGLAALREHPLPIAADESLAERSPEAVLDAGADVLVLKPMVLGGVARAVAAAGLARERGAAAVVTTTIDGAVARLGALHAAATFAGPACGLATADRLETDLAPDPAPVRDGGMDLPDGPGLGIDPREVSTGA